jgi:hypothetical protein
MNNYQNAKDIRTDAEVEAHFKIGKKREAYIANKLPYDVKLDEAVEEFGVVKKYKQDAKIKLGTKTYKLEIKGSPYKPNYLDFKKHQIDKLVEWDGMVVYGTKDDFMLTEAWRIKELGLIVSAEESKVKTISYRVRSEQFVWKQY